jgi:hypothetical protein
VLPLAYMFRIHVTGYSTTLQRKTIVKKRKYRDRSIEQGGELTGSQLDNIFATYQGNMPLFLTRNHKHTIMPLVQDPY